MTRRESNSAPVEIYGLLYSLGLTAADSAFFHLAYAVGLAADQPQRLLAPEWLYPETARHYGVDPRTVERGVRRLSARAWGNAPERLSRMAGAPLHGAPPPIRFLSILAGVLRGGRAA